MMFDTVVHRSQPRPFNQSINQSDNQSENQPINQSKTLFNFVFVDSKITNIFTENKSIK